MTEVSLVNNTLRSIFAPITYFAFELIEWVLYGMFDIAGLQISEGLIGDIYIRIYVLLGIFMVFKLSISFITYMVNPDSMADKEKGAGKLISRVITMLALLILLPNLFPLLNRVQTEFLPVLPRVILGQNVDVSNTVSENAKILSASALSAVYYPNTMLDESDRPSPITTVDDFMSTFLDSKGGYYSYNFNWALAPIIGIIMVVILLSMTIKIGIRLFKMFILELIAPIPVMNYIDPKASKDGAFAAWTKQLTTTFLDIFIRLGVIYVVIMILGYWGQDPLKLSGLFSPNSVPNNAVRLGYLQLFLTIALLMFAKDAPNFVKDAFGIKHDKDTSGVLAGLAAGATGAGTGAISGLISGRGLSGMVTGAAAGAGAGWATGTTGKKVSAWRTGGDAAIQARTGDSKAKSGIMAAIQSSTSKAQLARSAKKLNLTDTTIEQAKSNMLEQQALASQAQRNWEFGLHTGNFFDLEGNSISMEQADALVAETSTHSAIATKNYEKMNKAGDAYGINRSFAGDLAHERKKSKKAGDPRAIYKAKGRANPYKK